MELKHHFVPVLDVSEKVPFTISLTGNVKKDIFRQESAKAELDKFIKLLEKNLGEKLVYIGMDVIGEKYYERFLIEKGGFIEIMMEAPLAINAHFCSKPRAKKFEKAIKEAFKKTLPKNSISKIFIENISVSTDQTQNIKVKTWDKLKDIRKNV